MVFVTDLFRHYSEIFPSGGKKATHRLPNNKIINIINITEEKKCGEEHFYYSSIKGLPYFRILRITTNPKPRHLTDSGFVIATRKI